MAAIYYRNEDGNFVEIPLGTASDEQIATAVDEYFAENPNASSGVDLSGYYLKEETDNLLAQKADKATTLAGYGITDAYTIEQVSEIHTQIMNSVSDLQNEKADKETAYTKTEVDTKLGDIDTALDEIIAIQSTLIGGEI